VPLQAITYGYDENGNLDARTQAFARVGQSGTDSFTEHYNYDDLDRLDDFTVNGATSNIDYDNLGNITSKFGAGTYSYDPLPGEAAKPHAVQKTVHGSALTEYRYDRAGNMIERRGGVTGGTQTITYTPFNLPERITLGSGGGAKQLDYEYDAAQQRVLLSVSAPGGTTSEQRIYVGSGYERLVTSDSGGPVTRHLYKVMAGAKQVAQVEREVRGSTTTESRRYIHGDHLGSSQLITNESGALVHLQRFDPFGTAIQSASSSSDVPTKNIRAGFTGHEMDSETGLINMRGRLYDSRIGRFLQADPPFMESPLWSQGLNPYSYVMNNPLNLVDPSGFESDWDYEFGGCDSSGCNDGGGDDQSNGGVDFYQGPGDGVLTHADGTEEPIEGIDAVVHVSSDVDDGAEDAAEIAPDAEQREEATEAAYGEDGGADDGPSVESDEPSFGHKVTHYAVIILIAEPVCAVTGCLDAEGSVGGRAPQSTDEGTRVLSQLAYLAGGAALGSIAKKGAKKAAGKVLASSRASAARALPNQMPGLLAQEARAAARVGAVPIQATINNLGSLANQGTLKWVVTEGGQLMLSPHTVQGVEISHAVLSGGRPVLAAGHAEIAAGGGELVGLSINASSGHFGQGAVEIGKAAFGALGVVF
jgi:RHS repeat-associated protein